MQQKLSIVDWGLFALLAVDCAMKLWVGLGIAVDQSLLPDVPGMKKQLEVPALVFGTIFVTVPSLIVIGVPRFRSPHRFYFVAGLLIAEGIILLCYFIAFSIQVANVLAYMLAGMAVLRLAKNECAQQGAEPDAGERIASSSSGSGAG